jgi:hypothetical protein
VYPQKIVLTPPVRPFPQLFFRIHNAKISLIWTINNDQNQRICFYQLLPAPPPPELPPPQPPEDEDEPEEEEPDDPDEPPQPDDDEPDEPDHHDEGE